MYSNYGVACYIKGLVNEGMDNHVDNKELIEINDEIRYSDVEIIGAELREAMEAMEAII